MQFFITDIKFRMNYYYYYYHYEKGKNNRTAYDNNK